MATKEYLASLGGDYLKNNKMFSGNSAIQVNTPNTMFQQDNTGTMSEQGQSAHEFRMETDPE